MPKADEVATSSPSSTLSLMKRTSSLSTGPTSKVLPCSPKVSPILPLAKDGLLGKVCMLGHMSSFHAIYSLIVFINTSIIGSYL